VRETVTAETQEKPRTRKLAWAAALLDDPILLKELRAAFRRKRFFWLQTGLLALVALIVLITMWAYTDEYRRDPSEIGRRTFLIFATLEIGLIFFIFPAFACTAITDERTNKSIDLLLTTNLSPSRIVLGKTLAAFVYGLQFIVATLPLVALTFLYGGVTPGQIVLTYGVMVLIAALITIHALSVSSAATSTLRAVLSTYIGVLLIVLPLTLPLLTTAPLSFIQQDGKWNDASNGSLSGILAIHVFGPLQKDEGLLKIRDQLRDQDALMTLLYWGGHALFYASAIALFFLIARHRIAPGATNRSTPLRVWFLTTFGLFLAGTLVGLVHTSGAGNYGVEALITLEVGLFFIFVAAAIAFAGEDPAVPRRLLPSFDSMKRLRAPLRLLFPGGANGLRFVFWTAFVAHTAAFLVFLHGVGIHDLAGQGGFRAPYAILLWGIPWSFLFVVFVAQLSFVLSCELRHEIASRACAAIAIVALSLGPFLWYVLEYPEKKAYPYKGYWASPVTVALSILTPGRETDRQLYVLGPSGFDIRSARDAVDARLAEFDSPPGDRPSGDPVERTRAELEKAGVDDDAIEVATAEVRRVVPRVPKEPGPDWNTTLETLRNEERSRVVQALAVRGVPVHQVSLAVYLGLVFGLAIAIQRRYRRFLESGRAE